MTRDEFRKKIVFSLDDSGLIKLYRATFTACAELGVSDYEDSNSVKTAVQEQLEHELLRHIYTDKRRELYPLLQKLLCCSPYNYIEHEKITKELLEMVSRW